MTIDLQELFPSVKPLDEKSIYALLGALKRNFTNETFEYLKYRQSVLALQKMDMDEATAHKSSFSTAMTMGLTKEKLLSSAKRYVDVLGDEREAFATVLLSQKAEKIDGRKAEVQKMAQKIIEHKQRIKELETEIKHFQERIDNVDQDVESAALKINETKGKFLNVHDALSAVIKSDIDTINKYL